MSNKYRHWKKKWNKSKYSDEFKTNPNYPTVVDNDWAVWFKDKNSIDFVIHRLDGPAVIYYDDSCTWYFNSYSVARFSSLSNKWEGIFYDWTVEQGMDIDNLTKDDKILIKLVWAGYGGYNGSILDDDKLFTKSVGY